MDYRRNIPVSIIKGIKPEIKGHTKLYDLLRQIVTDEKLIERGKELKHLYLSDYKAYKRRKDFQPGFVLGNFSYRDSRSVVEYFPIMGFDIDKVKEIDHRNRMIIALKEWEYSFVVLPSVSGLGLRVLICTDSTLDTHGDYYKQLCRKLAKVVNVPLKSKIRESLSGLGKSKDEVNEYIEENTHIDDSMSDVSRFWYFSGVSRSEVYFNENSTIYTYQKEEKKPKKKHSKPNNQDKDYPYVFTDEDKLDYLVSMIEATGADITAGVRDWFKIGQAIYEVKGDSGEGDFHRVSNFHPDYDYREASREWNRIRAKYIPGKITIGTFITWCEKANIKLDFDELKKIHSHKFESKEKPKAPEKEVKKEFDLYDPEAERCVLATCISDDNLLETVFDSCPKFSHNCFYDEHNQAIFQAIQKLNSERLAVNIVSVKSKLKFSGSEFDEKVNKLISQNFFPDDISTNVKIVYDFYLKRQLIVLSQKAISDLSSKDVDIYEYLETIESGVRNVGDLGVSKTESDTETLARLLIEQDEKMIAYRKQHGKTALTGVPTGIVAEDDFTSGFQPSDLIIVAARPGMGKTSKVLCNALGAAKAGYPVGFFSLEMSGKQLGQRAASVLSGVGLKKIRECQYERDEHQKFINAVEYFSTLPIIVDDRASVTVDYIYRTATKWKRKYDIKLIVLDYLQLVSPKDGRKSKNEQVSEISRQLKILAKDLNVPVMALSQLSRAVEVRGGTKRPQLSDLRDSGAIEQDADVVQFIYRPEYYQILQDEEGVSLEGVAEIIYAKHRNGQLGSVHTLFEAETTSFKDDDRYKAESIVNDDPEFWEEKNPIQNVPVSKMNTDDEIPF